LITRLPLDPALDCPPAGEPVWVAEGGWVVSVAAAAIVVAVLAGIAAGGWVAVEGEPADVVPVEGILDDMHPAVNNIMVIMADKRLSFLVCMIVLPSLWQAF
jgi:hypothetical protein